ncbi:prepilin-type N-terminal cleavage/methylation domain-containing protein [Acaryochloris sp. IP29b_bin.148]|uniref:prepilin-type N-terminal cleavage/methylation domain-containing protein n=1 Tax=Acaryochloris sp. IP29b_bin.148 TaxID=2969218 RepID=UPI002619A76F|nr:prepilin-type N-terminal cleavage/methylation domain-containing protein [Acaryochloris sp. IP29b_bin.148]
MVNQLLRQQIIDRKPSSQGFTLPEVLVAAAITLGVVALGGFGLVSIFRSSQVANAQNERRVELNRSLEFIATEIRHADRIVFDADQEPEPPNFTTNLPTGAEPVLVLKMSDIPDSQQSVVYYTAPSPNDLWVGPRVIFRWGPKYNNDGTYSDPSDSANWSHEPLIDSIQASSVSPDCPNADWTANGNLGFGACVDSTGKIAQLFHAGVYDLPIQGSDSYTASTTVATRNSKSFAPSGSTSTGGTSTGGTSTGGTSTGGIPTGSPPSDDTPVTILEPSTLDVQVLGSEITCGSGGDPLQTLASYSLTLRQQLVSQASLSTVAPLGSQTNISVAPGTQLSVDGSSTPSTLDENGNTNGTCPGRTGNISASSDSNSERVLTLQNGDSLPNITPFGGQLPIATITQGYIDANGRVTIADNQVIFLFELGRRSPGDPSYDYQDLVILATITPDV